MINHSLKITVFISLFLLSACSFSNPSALSQPQKNANLTDTEETQTKTEIQSIKKTYHLHEISEKREASCFYYELLDSENTVVQVSTELSNVLECPFTLPILSPDSQKIIYLGLDNALYLYEISSQTQIKIMSFLPDTTGINLGTWSPDQQKLSLLSINNEDPSYPEISKLFILNFDSKYNFLNKDRYNIKVNFSCGSANCSPSPEDLNWILDTEIQYKTWSEVPYDLEDKAAKRTLYIK